MTTHKCSAIIEFGDDFGDNETTFHCSLLSGHDGHHVEEGDMAFAEGMAKPYRLSWSDEHKRGEVHVRIAAATDTTTESAS